MCISIVDEERYCYPQLLVEVFQWPIIHLIDVDGQNSSKMDCWLLLLPPPLRLMLAMLRWLKWNHCLNQSLLDLHFDLLIRVSIIRCENERNCSTISTWMAEYLAIANSCRSIQWLSRWAVAVLHYKLLLPRPPYNWSSNGVDEFDPFLNVDPLIMTAVLEAAVVHQMNDDVRTG